jgi:putative ABC transport system substrate-binding protein
MSGFREYVDAGGLMSYGTNLREEWRRVAAYVDRILRGARPIDLPVAQLTHFEFVISRRIAAQLGLQVPTSPLLMADALID